MTQIAFAVFTVPIRVAATASQAHDSLDGILTTPLASGVLARVTSVQKEYALDITSTAPADGVNIIAPRAGPGRWILQEGGGSAEFLTQPTWFINAVTGNDENDGATSGTAIASWAELARRWGDDPVLPQTTDVFIETDLAEDIFVRGTVHLEGLAFLRITGAVTATLHSGSITAKTDLDPASNQPSEITDAAVGDWDTAGPGGTSLIDERIRLTSGANVGAVAWLAKRVSATEARTSPFGTVDTSGIPPAVFPTLVDPAVTDTYAVESLTTVQAINLSFSRSDDNANSTQSACLIESLAVDSPDRSRFSNHGGMAVLVVRSALRGWRIAGGLNTFSLCLLSAASVSSANECFALASLWNTAHADVLNVIENSRLAFNRDCLLQGMRIRMFPGTTLEVFGLGIFDAPGDGIQVQPGAIAAFSGLVWGDGNTGVGIDCEGAGRVAYATASKPIITGTAGDTRVGDDGITAYAAIPLFNVSDGSAIVESDG